jgi:branched-chain amino acid transport system permease protein
MFFQQLINGLMLGSTYALIAVGYSLIFGVMGLLHFAHGEVFMVGAFIALEMVILAHLSLPVATIGAMIGTAILGIVINCHNWFRHYNAESGHQNVWS